MKRKQIFLLAFALLLLLALFVSCKRTPAVQVNLTMVPGNGNENTVVQVESGKNYDLPTLTREGYEFGGWFTSSDFTGNPVTSLKPEADTTVYAKWDKLYTLTLDPAGGTLANRKATLKAGEKLAEKLAGVIPEKADSQFGAWMLYGEELPEDATMGEEDITLVAKYRVRYTVELYLQNTARNGYEKSAEIITGYEYAGTAFTSAETVKGFSEVANANSVTRLTISDDASQNVFRHYYDRAAYTLTFVSNYPDGSSNERKTERLYFGVETPLPRISFEMNGYYLEGWATSAGGKAVYSSHLMDSKLHKGETPAEETITADGNVTLYAVWSKGYTNLFGGADILYVSASEAKTVYLYRGNWYFKGILQGKNIVFPDASTDFPTGILNDDGKTFLFLSPERAEISATLYEVGKGLNSQISISFSTANEIFYVETISDVLLGGSNTLTSEGTFLFDDDGNMVATFTKGPLSGRVLVIVVGQITVNNEQKTAFQIRNDEELELGKILFFTVKNNAIVPSTDENGASVGDITLNGFGIAAFNAGNGSITNFYYVYDAEKKIITMRDSSGQNTYVLKLFTVNGELGYMVYNESSDVSYTVTGGGTLSIDGMRTATYTAANGTTVSGFYTAKNSVFGGTILTFSDIATGKVYVFLITSKVVQTPVDPTDPDGESKRETVTTVEQKQEGYAEFYYKDDKGTYYGPVFVFESADRTRATVYGYSKNKEYYKIAVGTLVYDEETDTYTFTVTEHIAAPEGTEPNIPLDFDKISSCVLMLDSTTTQYSIHFWFSYTNDVETIHLSKVYNGANGGKLTLVGGLAIYQINGKTEIGTYQQSGELTTVTFADRTLYFYLNDTDSTFEVYSATATTYYEVGKDGMILQTRYLVIDPRAGSIIFYVITGEGEAQVITQYEGKLTNTGSTSLTGFTVYEFASLEKQAGSNEPVLKFRFIQRSTSATKNYIFVYDEAYAGSFVSTNTKNGVLTLDGFGFAATYSDADGNTDVMGMYVKDGDNVTISGSKTYYFVLNGSTCALRGDEYGKAYLVIDNQVFENMFAEFDGIGGAKLFTMKSNGTETTRVDIDAEATYTLNDGVLTLVYHIGNEEHILICRIGVYTLGTTSYNALNVVHDEVVYSYVNEKDWSVLRLNNDGTAIKYLSDGSVESGTYSLVSETLLYYVNSSATEAFIYVYDKEAGTATPRSYSSVAYYTKELDSLQFSQYGFAIFNNSTRYYYTIDDNGYVTLYYLDENATNKNRYGYVADTSFGKLDDTKDYNGKSYFKNDGFAISFNRTEANKDKYPVLLDSKNMEYGNLTLLTFAPNGSETFSVTGRVVIGEQSYSCTVVKELRDGTPVMYVRVGYHYFYITINYQGDGIGSSAKSTYEVTGHSYINTLPSYTYLYYLYYISSIYGSSVASQFPNEYGEISLNTIYKENGEEDHSFLNGTFGKSSGFLDASGTMIDKVENAPLYALGSNYYRADFKAADGYNYHLIINATAFSVFSTYAYRVYGLIREEAVPANDGYTMTVSRFVASEAGISAGSYFAFLLSKDGVDLESDNVVLVDGKLYYVVRTTDENGKVTATDYYLFTLTEKSDGSLDPGEEEEEKTTLPIYESATVTKIAADTVYTADGRYYVDILPDHQIIMMVETVKNGDKTTTTVHLIADCQYDEATGVYTLTTSEKKTYTVKIEAGVATVTEVTEAAA